jgi:tetraacyldisaccharide 4'-kinase
VPSPSFSSRLKALWYRPAPPPPPSALRLLALLFGVIVRGRRALYTQRWRRSFRLSKPVVVIGNITVGGSGKTPLVIWLVAQLRAAGLVPGVVLRGYGGSAVVSRAALKVDADSNAALVGDEALLLRQRTGAPVAVCRDRVRAARLLIEQGVNVIVSDDGLQHFALARSFEIAVVDGSYGLGNGYLLPAGPLREPLERLEHVDAVVINGEGDFWIMANASSGPGARRPGTAAGLASSRPFTMRLSGERLWSLDPKGDPVSLASLAGRRVHAVAGIGHPQRFFELLRAAGLEVIEHPFPDHHRFREMELQFGDDLPVLMTEKDAVKCRAFAGTNRWYLPISASFGAAESTALLGRLRRGLDAHLH